MRRNGLKSGPTWQQKSSVDYASRQKRKLLESGNAPRSCLFVRFEHERVADS